MSQSDLSRRGFNATKTELRTDMNLFFEANNDLWHKKKNPNGKFPLNLAENNQSWKLMKAKMEEILQNTAIPKWVSNYTAIVGHSTFLESIAQFMSKYVTGCPINHENLAASSGSTAVVELCAWILCDAGDVAMIPAPCYPVYTQDIKFKADVERYDLITHHELTDLKSGSLLNIGHLETAVRTINKNGKVVRLLLLTNPDNPTGIIYSKKQMHDIANWCMKNKIHLVVNELYALSTIDVSSKEISGAYSNEFENQSFAQIINDEESDYLHMIYGMSKDFGISGMRVGVVYSKNQEFLTSYNNLNAPHMVSNLAQWLVQEVLSDRKFIKKYIASNQRSLTQSYSMVTTTLDDINIPYVPARGSLFVWLDMSEFLKENTEAAEQQLWKSLYEQSGVLLTPGTGFGHTKKGQFRLVHSFLKKSALKAALKNMRKFVKIKRALTD